MCNRIWGLEDAAGRGLLGCGFQNEDICTSTLASKALRTAKQKHQKQPTFMITGLWLWLYRSYLYRFFDAHHFHTLGNGIHMGDNIDLCVQHNFLAVGNRFSCSNKINTLWQFSHRGRKVSEGKLSANSPKAFMVGWPCPVSGPLCAAAMMTLLHSLAPWIPGISYVMWACGWPVFPREAFGWYAGPPQWTPDRFQAHSLIVTLFSIFYQHFPIHTPNPGKARFHSTLGATVLSRPEGHCVIPGFFCLAKWRWGICWESSAQALLLKTFLPSP